LIEENIKLHTLPASLAKVKVDPSQVEQIILNLTIKARGEMPNGEMLTNETANVVLDQSHVDPTWMSFLAPCVMLAVSDNGHGMDPETKGSNL
jgi:two-component system, cell cycle sensor histidine kinase and response regulator CckA